MVNRAKSGCAKTKKYSKQRTKPYKVHPSDISDYLTQIKKSGRTDGTVSKYRTDLKRFEVFIGEEQLIYPETPSNWRQAMIDNRYAPRTINSSIVALNGFLSYIGCQDWQLFDWMELEDANGPELNRDEYQQLLTEAIREENIQLYLIVKTLACTDLTPSDLNLLTREAVNCGAVKGRMRGTVREVTLPELLRSDLFEFAIHRGIKSGLIFLNGSGKPYDRTGIANLISGLGARAGLEPGKANPRNLRRLYQNTLGEFQIKASAWVENSYIQLLNEEETRVGWRVYIPNHRISGVTGEMDNG